MAPGSHFQTHIIDRQGRGDVSQQAIIWTNVDTALCRHMVSLAHRELQYI